ncbi:CubicO group peptidase (beta-lactamase class C family) [Novosphingobium hassiacum]|uniref:CubicO group peptidase (Beta-lactamase class C family) n=1 Tax=Novosphingobium hassiacum TaxID=173676 RepID=A0A7W5ZVY5_9SPHN|nr:serine hydrolase domain-containing protein [Novosphingobium hassiacum]MBB3859147.1 CubicO group peptidase (beta-lactamase class C family) [Novosphingobium hassiacum]
MNANTMNISRRGLIGSLGALAGTALMPRMAFASAAAEARFPVVTRMVDGYVSSGKLPGMIATLGQGIGTSALDIARGTLARGNPSPVDMDSLFRIYSMTKPVTGMAAMMLVDDGKLRLDQPLADLIPAFGKMQAQATPDGSITDLRPAKTQITIRHLLTHTAGLGYSIIQQGPIKDAYIKAGVVPGQASRMALPGLEKFTPLKSLAEFAEVLATLPLVYEPGTTWSYSVGLDLMGRVIEIASGMAFDQFLKTRLFDPLGMASTGFRVPEAQAPRLTTNYAVAGGMLLPIDPAKTSVYLDQPAYPFGGAGLVSSPRDYDRFLAMVLGYGSFGGRQVMSEAAVRLGTSNLLPVGTDLSRSFIKGNGFGAGGSVGLGEDAGTYGWAGAAGTVGFVSFRAGLRAGLYTQYMPSEAYPVHREFAQAVLADVTQKKAAA